MYEVEATADMLLMTGQGNPVMAQEAAQISPEALLVKAVLEGNRDSFGRLYELYAPMVHGILLARVPRTEVEDLVQDIFLHAFRKLPTLREAAAFGGWLAMITRNRAMDFHRYTRATVEVKEEHAVGDRRKRAKAEEILDVIRSLPDAYRETLVLKTGRRHDRTRDRFVERQIRVLHKLIRIRAVARRDCDTDACPHDDLVAVDLIWRAHCINQTCRERDRVCRLVECVLQDCKLVSAQPSDDVGLTDTAAHALGHRLQQLVPDWMSKRIVDALEVVKVQTEDREGAALRAHVRSSSIFS